MQPLSDDRDVRRKMLAILRVLSGSDEPLGARAIGRELETLGIDLSERQVRYHLQFMDERGLTQAVGNAGRVLTDNGRHELDSAQVADKVGFVAARIDRLAYSTTFDPDTGEGEVILNVSLMDADDLPEALEHARVATDAGLCMSDLTIVAHEGETLGETVPEGKVAVGTICSVTLNGVLLHHYIPVKSVYGGLLQVREGRPLRFVELVSYEGSSIDP
ncbi:MAG: NrpR regulatory domain-containing protein, partial [Armatimonadota bacterium]